MCLLKTQRYYYNGSRPEIYIFIANYSVTIRGVTKENYYGAFSYIFIGQSTALD